MIYQDKRGGLNGKMGCKECSGEVKFERHYKDSLDKNGFIIEEEREAEEIYRCQDCGEENYLIQLIAEWRE